MFHYQREVNDSKRACGIDIFFFCGTDKNLEESLLRFCELANPGSRFGDPRQGGHLRDSREVAHRNRPRVSLGDTLALSRALHFIDSYGDVQKVNDLSCEQSTDTTPGDM